MCQQRWTNKHSLQQHTLDGNCFHLSLVGFQLPLAYLVYYVMCIYVYVYLSIYTYMRMCMFV